MQGAIDGILLVDKGPGLSSYDVVRGIRSRMIDVRGKKVGHAGTLDPFATGLLILLLGQGTKLSPFLMGLDKTYRATMRLGLETDTLDLTGKVTSEREVPGFTVHEIREAASRFVGTLEQEPPSYSALKVGGKRAYALARKGLPVHLEKRLVTVESIEILSVDLPDVTMDVTCSKGTYLRRLASDLGGSLGPGAHLRALRRLAVGPFSAANAVTVGAALKDWSVADLVRRVIPLREALPHMKAIFVDERIAADLRQGRPVSRQTLEGRLPFPASGGRYMRVLNGEDLVAVARIQDALEGRPPWIKIERTFASTKTIRETKEGQRWF